VVVVLCNSCVTSMLRSAQEEGLTSHQAVLKYVGERFRLKAELPPWTSDEDVTRHLLRWVIMGEGVGSFQLWGGRWARLVKGCQ